MWTLHTAFNRSYLWYLGTNKCDPFTPKMEKKGVVQLFPLQDETSEDYLCALEGKTSMILHEALSWPTANALSYFSIFLLLLFIFPCSFFFFFPFSFSFLFTSCISFSIFLSSFPFSFHFLPSSSFFLKIQSQERA